jgi:hypothetical protein
MSRIVEQSTEEMGDIWSSSHASVNDGAANPG